ncbi:MAG TPA: c-type cytochrome [Mucilaginibacter sp.]|jgi:cytochrome c|nr:c-type cytochrome [Mucilaginibacter sp.]
MKKTFIVLGLSLVIAACGGGKSSSGSADSTNTANKTATATSSDAAQDTAASHNGTEKAGGTPSAAGAQLIAKADCGTCHKEKEKLIGPAFADVANKYTSADVDTLASKIIKGGSGHWGTVPMAPHPTISVDDAKSMVNYILSLKK